MKRTVIYFLIGFMSLLCFSSCSEQDEFVYSCDDEVNLWVKENLAQIQGMTRTSWKTLPADKKRAAYIAFTPRQKITFWEEKLTDVMALDWSKEELDHIKLLYNFIVEHSDYFEKEKLNDEQLNVLDLFFYKWIDVAQNELGWNMKLIASIAATGEDLQLHNTRIGGDLSGSIGGPSSDRSCHCNVAMLSDFCNISSQGICEDVACVGSTLGCGWLLLEECNGRCSDVIGID